VAFLFSDNPHACMKGLTENKKAKALLSQCFGLFVLRLGTRAPRPGSFADRQKIQCLLKLKD